MDEHAQTADEVRSFFDENAHLPMAGDVQGALQMDMSPRRGTVADMILHSFAAAYDTLSHWSDFFSVGDVEIEDKEETIQKMKEHDVGRTEARLHIAVGLGINEAFTFLSPERESVPFSAQDVLDWRHGEGREATVEDLEAAGRIIMGIDEAIDPLRKHIESYVRDIDFQNGLHRGIFTLDAWIHYVKGLLGDCNCKISTMANTHGYNVQDLSASMNFVERRFKEVTEEYEKTKQKAQNKKSLSDVAEEEHSETLEDFVEEHGDMFLN